MEVKKMYKYLKERKSEGKFTKAEETKFACIEDKIGRLYNSYNIRMAKTTEKETKKQVRGRINALTIEQKTKLLFLLDSVESNAVESNAVESNAEEVTTKMPESQIEEPEEA